MTRKLFTIMFLVFVIISEKIVSQGLTTFLDELVGEAKISHFFF